MGHPRRHPFARRRVVQGKEQGRAVGAAVARGTGPDRIARRGAGRGDQKAIAADRRPGRCDHLPGRTYGRRLFGQEPQLRQLFLHRRRGRTETLRRDGGQDGRRARGLGRQGIARAGAGPRAATPAARNVRHLRRQPQELEHLRPAEGELPQLRPAVGPLQAGAAAVRRAEHDAPLGNQIRPLGVHRPQRRAVHLREGRQPLRTLHDRRISGHLRQGVGELPAPAAKRHVAERGDLGADRGRHQAVDLPLAGRRLENPPLAGTGAARPGQHRGGDTQGELPQPALPWWNSTTRSSAAWSRPTTGR